MYDSTDGKYTVTDEKVPDARVELIVFEEDPMVNNFATKNYYYILKHVILFMVSGDFSHKNQMYPNCFVYKIKKLSPSTCQLHV